VVEDLTTCQVTTLLATTKSAETNNQPKIAKNPNCRKANSCLLNSLKFLYRPVYKSVVKTNETVAPAMLLSSVVDPTTS